jgi:hypothetical protein
MRNATMPPPVENGATINDRGRDCDDEGKERKYIFN